MLKDDEFLKQFVTDSHNAMRWRSETEYRLLNMFAVLNPVVITATLGVGQIVDDKKLTLAFPLSLALFLTVLTVSLTVKILAEHRMYEAIGQQVVRVWEYFGLFEKGMYVNDAILTEKARGFGTGRGYAKTLCILWAMMIATDATLVAIGFIRYIG